MNVHVIIGEDDYVVAETARKIVGDGVGLELIDSATASNAELQIADLKRADESLSTPPFLEPKKVTWWKNVAFLPGGKCSAEVKEALERFADKLAAADLPDNQHFILSGPKLLKTSIFAKKLAGAAEMVVFESEKPSQAQRSALQRALEVAAEEKLAFEPGAAELFVSVVGPDVRSIVSEIAKLKTYIGPDATRITKSDVESITSPGAVAVATSWAVTDAVGARDLDGALRAIRKFELESGFEVRMTTTLEAFFRMLVDVKLGKAPQAAPFVMRKNEMFASKWSLAELRRARSRFLALREKVVSGVTSGAVLVITELVRAIRRPRQIAASLTFAAFAAVLLAGCAPEKSVSPRADAWLDEYRGDYGLLRRERAEMRLEAMRRLEAIGDRDAVMEAELAEFKKSFPDDLAHWRLQPLNPSVKSHEIDVRVFGAVGDGMTDDSAAIDRAIDAARAFKGEPTLIRVPKGVYFLGSSVAERGSPRRCQLAFSVMTNVAFVGESPETTRFEFGVYDCNGISLYKAANVAIEAVSFRWWENPFSQIVVESYDANTGWVTGRRTPGTLDPTDPRYRKADHSQCMSVFDGAGKQKFTMPTVFFDFQAQDLGGGRFRVHIDTKRPGWRGLKLGAGDYLVLPDRRGFSTTFTYGSSYLVFDRVWVYNARSAAIAPSGCRYPSTTRCRTVPFSDDLVFSSNADTHYCARGTHLAHCEFRNMNDDGANCLGAGVEILERRDDHTLVISGVPKLPPQPGDIVQIVDAITGDFRYALTAASCRFLSKPANSLELKVRETVPADVVTCREVPSLTPQQRYDMSHGLLKITRCANLLYAPVATGTGFTMKDCRISNLRGVGLNIQCPHSIIEGNVFENIVVGIKLSALMDWFEGTPPRDVLIRGNTFRNLQTGISSYYQSASATLIRRPFIDHLAIISNRFENVRRPCSLNSAAEPVRIGNVETAGKR